eukprot:765960-Hanusia_phi.AAC.2
MSNDCWSFGMESDRDIYRKLEEGTAKTTAPTGEARILSFRPLPPAIGVVAGLFISESYHADALFRSPGSDPAARSRRSPCSTRRCNPC